MTMTFAQSSGLSEGSDYWFAPAGVAVEPAVDSVLVTREAFDQILNEITFLREKVQAGDVALEACRSLVAERETLAEMLENSKQKWWVPVLSAGAAGLGGYLAGQNQCDTVVVNEGILGLGGPLQ